MIVRLLCLWRQEIVYKYEQEVTEVIIYRAAESTKTPSKYSETR